MTDNQKKIQANQIKTYLQERIKKIESGEIGGWELFRAHEKYILNEGSNEVIFSWGPDLKESNYHFITTPESYETKNQEHIRMWDYGLEKEYYLLIDPQEDYAEIVSLAKQRDQLKQTKITQWEKERDQKLANNPKLFFGWWMSGSWAPADKRQGLTFAEFRGQKEGKNYWLMLPKNHPALVNLEKKEGQFYLIEELENIPIEPAPSRSTGENNPNNFNRWVELTDQITITPHNDNLEPKENGNKKIGFCNNCGADYCNIESWYYPLDESRKTSWEKLSWFCGECWKAEEKNWRWKSSQKNTVYKSEPQKSNLGDEHHYYFENGRWISLESGTPDPNITNTQGEEDSQPLNRKDIAKIWEKEWENKKNRDTKEMSISIIQEFFRQYNVKSIEITSSKDLLVEYNNGSSEVIKNDEKGTGIIKNSLNRVLNKNKLDQQELEKLKTGSHSPQNASEKVSPKSSYLPYLIGGGIIISVLGTVGIIIYRRSQKKKK